jgi:hypothetical protein
LNLFQALKAGSTSKNQLIYHTIKPKKKNHIIVPILAEKCDKIKPMHDLKTLSKLGIEGMFLN